MKTPQTVAGLKKDEPAVQSTANNDKEPQTSDYEKSMLQQVEEIFSQEEAQLLGAIHGTDKEFSKHSAEAQGISQAGLIKRDINQISTTGATGFLATNSTQAMLFSVNPGIPALDALQVVSCLLNDALNAMADAECHCFAAERLVNMGKAVVDSLIGVAEFGEEQGGQA